MSIEFDFGKWKGKLLFEPARYEFLHLYVSDEKALVAHAKDYKITKVLESGNTFQKKLSEESEAYKDILINEVKEGINEALEVLGRQMVVVAASYLEGMINEFFQSLFLSHPERMYDFLRWHPDSPKGWLPLKLILESDDKDELLVKVASQASDAASSGNIKEILKRMEKLGCQSLDKSLSGKVIGLLSTRNKIVHEQFEPSLTKEKVKAAFELADQFLMTCANILNDNGAAIHDPTGYIQKQ